MCHWYKMGKVDCPHSDATKLLVDCAHANTAAGGTTAQEGHLLLSIDRSLVQYTVICAQYELT